MKLLLSLLACGLAAAAVAQTVQPPGAPPADTPYAVVERGADHKVWQRVTWTPDAFGFFTPVTNSYTELQTSMAHLVNGQWVDSSDQIQVTATGAQATNSGHSVVFLGNINSAGAVSVTTPEGKRLTSNILGLTYFDTASSQSVWIGEIQDSVGQLLPTGNQAVFPDAFSGCLADVMYVKMATAYSITCLT